MKFIFNQKHFRSGAVSALGFLGSRVGRQPLSPYPSKQTSGGRAGMSQKCQYSNRVAEKVARTPVLRRTIDCLYLHDEAFVDSDLLHRWKLHDCVGRCWTTNANDVSINGANDRLVAVVVEIHCEEELFTVLTKVGCSGRNALFRSQGFWNVITRKGWV